MAFTKITNAGFGLTTGTLVGVAASFSSTVSVGGTLTYEDVTNVDSVGLITARNGIEVTDKGVQVGTGATVDSAAANTLTFLTGGSERVRIKSDGFLGINDSNPDTRLSVNSGTTDVVAKFASSDANAWIQFRDNTTTDTAVMVGANGDNLLFRAGSNERARITSGGNFGLDTTNPQAPFVVSNSGAQGVEIGYSGGSSSNYVQAYNRSSSAFIQLDVIGSPLLFKSGSSATERMRLDTSGRLLVGATSSRVVGSARKVQIEGTSDATAGVSLVRNSNDSNSPTINIGKSRGTSAGSNTVVQSGDGLGSIYFRGADGTDLNTIGVAIEAAVDGTPGSNDLPGRLVFGTTADGANSTTERMRINSSGSVLIGSATAASAGDSQYALLQIAGNTAGTSGSVLALKRGEAASAMSDNDSLGTIVFTGTTGGDFATILGSVDGSPSGSDFPGRIVFSTTTDGGSSPVERMRIDSNGTIHMGDRASAGNAAHFSTATVNISKPDDLATSFSKAACFLHIGNASSTLNGVYPIGFGFSTNDRTHLPAYIQYITEDAGGAEHGPITFGTRNVTTDAAPSERMRIASNGDVLIARTSASISNVGHYFLSGGATNHTRSGDTVMVINRLANDGNLIGFRQADSLEGSISVSGSSVSYNGGHLSRWSQLVGISTNIKSDRPTILKGSVLSNLDEMCEWGDENNEQLNRMKVSDVEGDINVAGVFQAWDDDDDTYTNDFYCAMTGDFVIRIASGVTVQRGNLLMSAGDGTAKPQGDGYIQDKTIAKVTSTTVSTTYSDGSYCVPCVLMAC